MDFGLSTHHRKWTFTRKELDEKRRAVQQAVVARLNEAGAAGSSAPTPELLSVEDEALLRRWNEKKLQEVTRAENAEDASRFTRRVMATAQLYFKRFFLQASLMEADPKGMMLAAIFLAGKVGGQIVLSVASAPPRRRVRRLGPS